MLETSMANSRVKGTSKRSVAGLARGNPRIIDLKANETGILSLVARYAPLVVRFAQSEAEGVKTQGEEIKTKLKEALRDTTPRARAIGNVMLGESARAKASYKLMAKRFTDAQISNAKNMEILRALSPRAL
jgi:hypothetical protein